MAAAAALALLMSACSGSSGEAAKKPPAPRTVEVFGEATGPLDEISWNLPYGEPNTLDPANAVTYSSAMVAMNACEPLTRLNSDYSVTDNLAKLSRPDDKTLVYDLEPGVTFWDGSPLTPADVVWSLKHAMDPASVTSFLFANVASIEATGDSQVTIKLSQPDDLLPVELATFAGAVQEADFSKKAGRKLGSAGGGLMCTGPYQVQSWTPGQGIELEANPNYWDDSRAPQVSHVAISFTTDSSAVAQALASGEYDGAYEVPAAVVPNLSSADSGQLVFGGPTQLYLALAALSTDGPMGSPKIREALFSTIDREAIAAVSYHGAASPNYTALNKDSWSNASITSEAQDVWSSAYDALESERSDWGSADAAAKAKALAAEGGYSGAPIVMATLAGDATQSQVAQLIQAQAKNAGIDVEIKQLQPIDYANAQFDPSARDGLDLILFVSFNAAPNPLEPMLFYFLPDSFYNFTGYKNAAVTHAIQEARRTTDPVEQARLLVDAQSIYEKDHLLTSLVQLDELVFVNKRIGGVVASFAYLNMPSFASMGASGQ